MKIVVTLIGLIASAIVIALTIGFFAFFSGTILWLVWPVGVPAAFPRIVNEGWLAPHLSWWQAVCFS
jgi:hypothetical protein